MDTSEIFVKMCEKAVEIQKKWKQSVGDYLFNNWSGNCFIVEVQDPIGLHDVIWLPRQDQFQEMIDWSPKDHPHTLIAMFYDFDLKWLKTVGSENPISMEQLWLAFVMKEKFGKTWNGENWEKEE